LDLVRSFRVLLVEDDPDDAALTRAQVSEDADTLFHVEWKDNIFERNHQAREARNRRGFT
jgi:hypothetical protein